jgi:hypothetical protein
MFLICVYLCITKPNYMKPTPNDFRRWQIHIRKACATCLTPDHAETISPFRVNWVLLGHVLNAKKA